MGSSTLLGSILNVHQFKPQVLYVVLDNADPPFSLSSPASLSANLCLQNSFDTTSARCCIRPKHLSLASRTLSKDATDVIVSYLVPQGKAKDPS